MIAEGQTVAEHRRIINSAHEPGQTRYDWRHYLSVLTRKPGALRNGAPFKELPEAFKRLQGLWLPRPGGDRDMVDILALVLQHDEMLVLQAVEQALKAGVPSKPHILNLLHRLTDPTPPAPIPTPAGLALTIEPQSNVHRYDHLCDTEEHPHAE